MSLIDTAPNETLAEILSSLPKTDLASVSKTCRRFQVLSERFRYRDVDLASHADNPMVLLQFLRTIIGRPILANYVRSLEVQWKIEVLDNETDIATYTTAAKDMKFLKSLNSPTSQLALLVYLLPNIRSLKLVPPNEFGTTDDFLVEFVVPRTASIPAVLKSVRDINYFSNATVAPPESILAMLSLPSIRKIIVRGPERRTELGFAMSTFTEKCSVTDLRFSKHFLPLITMTRLLDVATNLTHFTYFNNAGSPNNFEPAIFGRSLQGCRNTLQYLRLTFTNPCYIPMRQEDRMDWLDSLHDWPVLRSLWVPMWVLLGKVPRRATKRLVDVLPAVLEELRMGCQGYDLWKYPQVAEQVLEVLEQKRMGDGFPKLAMLMMMPTGSSEVDQMVLRAACEAAGVTLKINRHIFV